RQAGEDIGTAKTQPQRQAGEDIGTAKTQPQRQAGEDIGTAKTQPQRQAGEDIGTAKTQPQRQAGEDIGTAKTQPQPQQKQAAGEEPPPGPRQRVPDHPTDAQVREALARENKALGDYQAAQQRYEELEAKQVPPDQVLQHERDIQQARQHAEQKLREANDASGDAYRHISRNAAGDAGKLSQWGNERDAYLTPPAAGVGGERLVAPPKPPSGADAARASPPGCPPDCEGQATTLAGLGALGGALKGLSGE
ncbi:MAG: hypothetical protein AB7G46_09535, partial [Alphaproteobacteria bacterium]